MKVIESQENFSNSMNDTEGVSRSPRILTHISLTSLGLLYFPMLTHLFSANESFCVNMWADPPGWTYIRFVFLHQKALSGCKPCFLLLFMALLIGLT